MSGPVCPRCHSDDTDDDGFCYDCLLDDALRKVGKTPPPRCPECGSSNLVFGRWTVIRILPGRGWKAAFEPDHQHQWCGRGHGPFIIDLRPSEASPR